MENLCDRMLELDRGKCYMHNFGGPGSYEQFREARAARCAPCRCLSLYHLRTGMHHSTCAQVCPEHGPLQPRWAPHIL